MKIGAFSKKNNISVDTLRYYIDLALIVPIKKNTYYDFDDSCQNDLNYVLQLKKMGFKLKEISDILIKLRLGSISPENEKKYILERLKARLHDIHIEEQSIKDKKQKINIEIDKLKNINARPNYILGVQLEHLTLLYCNDCSSSYKLQDAIVQQGKILEGRLACNCGKRLTIENGIIIGKHNFNKRYLNISEELSNIYSDYINIADRRFLNELYYSINWILKHIKRDQKRPLIALEFGVGSGFFLKHFIKQLRGEDIYIAIDHDRERLESIRHLLIENGINKQIVLICPIF